MPKIYDLLNAQDALEKLAKRRMSGRLAYNMAKNIRMISEEIRDYDSARLIVCAKYGTPNGETHTYEFPPENIEAFRAEMDDLFNTEVERHFHAIPLDALDTLELTPEEAQALTWLIEEE